MIDALTAKDLMELDSIIIENPTVMDYILDWFDSQLDILGSSNIYGAVRNSGFDWIVTHICDNSRVRTGIFRYRYKNSVIRFKINMDRTISIQLYMAGDQLIVGPGVDKPVVGRTIRQTTTIRNLYWSIRNDKFVFTNIIYPNIHSGMDKNELYDIINKEIIDFIAVMLYAVSKPLPEYKYTPKKDGPKRSYTIRDRDEKEKSHDIVVNDSLHDERHPVDMCNGKHKMHYQFDVKPHYRHYASGKVVYIDKQTRCKNLPRPEELMKDNA